jgi:hypothetical protein
MSRKKIALETKRQIGIQLTKLLVQRLIKFTPVVVINDGTKIIDHGSGTFIVIDDNPIVITAAHVIKDYPKDMIHVIGTFTPSDFSKITPIDMECWGGEPGKTLDIGYLVLGKDCIDNFGMECFATLDDIDIYPEKLSTDITVFFGMPEATHDHLPGNQDRFEPFMYAAGIDDDTDWSAGNNQQLEFTMEYPFEVPDTITGRIEKLHNPSGMSGGGLWRSNINTTSETEIYTATKSRLIAIGTEWNELAGTIKANRIESVMDLLSLHFSSVEKMLTDYRGGI